MELRFSVWLAALLAAVSVRAGTPATSQGGPIHLSDLIAIAQANRDGLGTIDMTVSSRQKFLVDPKQSAPALVPVMEERVLFDLKTRQFRARTILTHPANSQKTVNVEAFDGAELSKYEPNQRAGAIAKTDRNGAAPRRYAGLLINSLMLPPTGNGHGIDDGSLVSMISSKYASLRPSREMVNGRNCCVVDLKFKQQKVCTVWIDPERGALPVRMIDYKRPDAKGEQSVRMASVILDARSFRTASGAQIWLPLKLEWTEHFPDFVTQTILEADPSKIRVNPKVGSESFRVPFPPGTRVYDKDTSSQFIQKHPITAVDQEWVAGLDLASTASLPIWPQSDAELHNQNHVLAVAPVPTHESGKIPWPVLVGLAVIGVGGVIAVLIFRVRQARRM